MTISAGSTGTYKKPVLLIEDDAAIRETLGLLFELEGFNAIFASNGQEGLDLLRKHSSELGLVLLDLMMPVMDGREFLEKLEKEGTAEQKSVPIYICSAVKEAGINHISGFLRKPLDLPQLLDTLKRHCI